MREVSFEKYFARKMDEIEGEIAVAVGAANLSGVMFGKTTDGVIKMRDEITARIQKIVRQIITRSTTSTPKAKGDTSPSILQ